MELFLSFNIHLITVDEQEENLDIMDYKIGTEKITTVSAKDRGQRASWERHILESSKGKF